MDPYGPVKGLSEYPVGNYRGSAQNCLHPSVYEESVRLSKQELQEVVREAVKQAVEEEREAMFQAFEYKLNNVIEQRDRHLTKELHRSLEEKRLEIAASKENIPWWRRLFN